MSQTVKLASVGLGLAGWVVLLAGVSDWQDTQSGKNLAHPLLIYSWWIMSFEFFSLAYALYVILSAPAKKVGAVGLFAVLTASTFLFCHELYIGDETITTMSGAPYMGIQYLIFKQVNNMPTNKYVSSLANLGQIGRSQICFFAGLVTCSIANAFVTLTIAEEEAAPAAEPSA